MFDDQSRKYKNQFVPLEAIDVDQYKKFSGDRTIEELKWIAEPLKGKVWANVNSTFVGGGVAEMLNSVVPFAKGLGIKCRWFVIEGTDEFFSVTKKFHNMLQGVKDPITMEEIFHAYLENIQHNLDNVQIPAHMVVVHDPQPAAAIMSGNIFGYVLWRCHIDTSEASRRIWRFLLPYINQFDGAIFTSPEFARDGIHIPIYCMTPAIDPLKEKNRQYTREEALEIVSPLFKKYNIDPSRPIVLAVSRYDVHKNQKTIIQAFKRLKAELSVEGVDPVLIIVGNCATDDPEGSIMYETILKEIGQDPDIYPLLNIEDNDRCIGSLMRLANCFVHISTKEGFGLVVTEAMWQGAPVIGSTVGGIKKQVLNEFNGFMVEPFEIDKIVKYMALLLTKEQDRETLSKNAVEHVRGNFLLPSLVRKYLILMRYYLEIDNKFPDFRVNDISYSEIRKAAYGRSVWPFSRDAIHNKIEALWEKLENQNSDGSL